MGGSKDDYLHRIGRTLHQSAAAATLGIAGASVIVDAMSQISNDQFVYARAGQTLIALTLAIGAVAVLFRVAHIARIPQGSPRRRPELVHLAVFDGLLLWFALRYFAHRDDTVVPVAPWVILLSGLVVAAGCVSHVVDLASDAGTTASDERSAPDPVESAPR